MRMKVLGTLAALLLVLPATAQADVVYTFTNSDSVFGYSLSFDEPSILTGTGSTTITSFLSASLTGSIWSSCGPITTLAFQFTDPSGTPGVDVSVSGCGAFSGFASPVDTIGVFNNGNTLSASIIATPEPGSLLLVCTGLLGLGGALRRKLEGI